MGLAIGLTDGSMSPMSSSSRMCRLTSDRNATGTRYGFICFETNTGVVTMRWVTSYDVAQARLVREAGGELVEHLEQLGTLSLVQMTDPVRLDSNTRHDTLINSSIG